ncbi:MAG: hypothetical protein AMJ64_14060 [Betaproteobacteria bacterium SG8_39]|nr:MAG: hypothetical protein AMJ64_14060 [Betaproteobacteria bacterium SG8_39]
MVAYFAKSARIIALSVVAAFLSPLATQAQSERIFRIGYMLPPSEKAVRSHTEGFLKGLREHGYIVGKNLHIEFRYANYDLSRLPGLAKELVELKPDVIVTASPPGVRAAQKATRSIPIVIAAVYDPVGLGFVQSLARPGGNITGLSVQYEDTIPKLLELIAATVPETRKIGVLQTVDASHDKFVRRITTLARSREIAVQAFRAREPAEIEPAFARIAEARSDAVLVLPHPLFNTRPNEVVSYALNRRLPGIYPFATYAQAGGLMSLGIDLPDVFRRAAYFVDRILRGAIPAELPVEQPTRIDLVVNKKTAKTLGITIPPSVLLRADRVIE